VFFFFRKRVAPSLTFIRFSNYFGRPSYQNDSVEAYFANAKLPAARFYNASGRGYPGTYATRYCCSITRFLTLLQDIAAFATNFDVIIGGGFSPVDGTSCAAPTASAIFSLLNDIRFQLGKVWDYASFNQFLMSASSDFPRFLESTPLLYWHS